MKKKVSLGIVFLLFPLFMFCIMDFSRETDIWFLLSHGRYILSNGIPHIEMLTMHSNLKFVMQQPGFSIIMYLLYKYVGSVGIITFIGLINILILFFLYKLCLLISSDNKYFSFLIASIIDLLLVLLFVIPRPQVISLLIFLILIYILEKYIRKDSKIVFFLPLLSLILINMHSAMWLMFFVLCMPYVVELGYYYFIKKDNRIKKLILIMIVSFIVGFINPYGYESMFYSINSYGISIINNYVTEMNNVNIFSNKNMVQYNSYLFIVLFLIQLIIIILNRKKYTIHEYLLFFGLSLMAFMNLRNISIFLLCSFPFVIKPIIKKFKTVISIKIFAIFIVAILSFYIYNCINGTYVIKDKKMSDILVYMNNNYSKNIKIFNYFDDGPYLEFNNYRAYIDTRAEVFIKKMNKKKDIFYEYIDIIMGTKNFDEFSKEYDFKVFIIEKDSILYKKLKNNDDYKIVYQNKYNSIFEKK